MRSRERIWFEVHTGGSARQRREARAAWFTAGQAARVLAEVRAALVVAASQGRGMRAAAYCVDREAMAAYRWRHVVRARDLLYHLRQARAAGVLRVRVPR